MNKLKTKLLGLFIALALLPTMAYAANTENSAVAIQGYDVVGYFTEGKPVKGDGNHAVMHDGLNYLFASDEHKKTFEANPDKYVPQYGGWCAYGVAVNKKFVGDPLVWKIVDGKLYLNLDQKVADIWVKDIPGYITKSEASWPQIKDKAPSEL